MGGKRVGKGRKFNPPPWRPRRRPFRKPELSIAQILQRADEFHDRTGRWPNADSGRVTGSLGETWCALDNALRKGTRGLAYGSSLARLLAEKRGVRNDKALPPLRIAQILRWADAHYERTGCWPRCHEAGAIPGSNGQTWGAVNSALERGLRGLPGGSSLAKLLAQRRKHYVLRLLPALTVKVILAWADEFRRRTGKWPVPRDGEIPNANGTTWSAVDQALYLGTRDLKGGSSLARLLEQHRGRRNHANLPPLTIHRILTWADAHRRRTGTWPKTRDGAIRGAPGETWMAVDAALQQGLRGLPGGSSLPRLLAKYRGVRNLHDLARLSVSQVLRWADAYYRRWGRWPTSRSGPIAQARGETWSSVNVALGHGRRGLPGPSSLARLLAQHRGLRHHGDVPRLSVALILAWADTFHARTGFWPNVRSGSIAGVPGETWLAVDAALRQAGRGLTGVSSLARLLHEHRQVPNNARQPPLTVEQIRQWARAYRRRTGKLPTQNSGRLPANETEFPITWRQIADAVRRGGRGLRIRSTLARLLAAGKH